MTSRGTNREIGGHSALSYKTQDRMGGILRYNLWFLNSCNSGSAFASFEVPILSTLGLGWAAGPWSSADTAPGAGRRRAARAAVLGPGGASPGSRYPEATPAPPRLRARVCAGPRRGRSSRDALLGARVPGFWIPRPRQRRRGAQTRAGGREGTPDRDAGAGVSLPPSRSRVRRVPAGHRAGAHRASPYGAACAAGRCRPTRSRCDPRCCPWWARERGTNRARLASLHLSPGRSRARQVRGSGAGTGRGLRGRDQVSPGTA